MALENLTIYKQPNLSNPRLIMGFSGWMDGGGVSTGTLKELVERTNAEKFAEIDPGDFYIYSFPAVMDVAAMFRPHTRIEQGGIVAFDFPKNQFFCSESHDLILFLGREPNLKWGQYSDCIFSLCEHFGVKMIYFIGSVAGLVPHTREPRLFCATSTAKIRDNFKHYGVNFTNYEGPASITTYLTAASSSRNLSMVSLVATIPAYVQGDNPKCIQAVTERLAGMLQLDLKLGRLRALSEEFEKKLSRLVQEQPQLAANIKKLEEDYDSEIFNTEMGDLKNWLEQQGLQVD
ncbi:MAG: PAC2 family protein [Phycisphaerales bacterium]|nr:MAG: PAC2 family protein [Phycisphaerales bacterium]